MSDPTRCDAMSRWISSQLPGCSEDELRVVARLIERFTKGREFYGPLDIRVDRRDFRKEKADELADWLFYLCAEEVAEQLRRSDAIAADVVEELAKAPDFDEESETTAFTPVPCAASPEGK